MRDGRGIRKFRLGDYARIDEPYAAYPWIRRGEVRQAIGIEHTHHGGHCDYVFRGARGYPWPSFRSDRLRTYANPLKQARGQRAAPFE